MCSLMSLFYTFIFLYLSFSSAHLQKIIKIDLFFKISNKIYITIYNTPSCENLTIMWLNLWL